MGEFVRSGSGNAKGGSNISFPPYLQLAPRRWGQRGQSVAALTARGRGLDCFQPQPRQPVLRRNKLRIFRFRASAKAQSLRLFLLSPQSGHFVGAPIMAGHCVSKQVGRHDAACQGCPRCVSRSPEARCLRVFARAVRVSQPAVLSALLVIQLFGIVVPPPYFPERAPKGALRPFPVAALLHYFFMVRFGIFCCRQDFLSRFT